MMGKDETESLATRDGWRDESISPTNYTNDHKFILEPSAILKVLHEFIRSYARMVGAVSKND